MDEKIIQSMKQQMRPSDEIVMKLMQQLDQMPERTCEMSHSSLYKRMAIVAACAAMLTVFMVTPIGRSAAHKIREWMRPHEVVEQVEGEKENNIGNPASKMDGVQKGNGYAVYVNEEFFVTNVKEDAMLITAVGGSKAKMTITKVANTDAKTCLAQQKKSEKNISWEKDAPLKLALVNEGICGSQGTEWDDTMTHIFCIEDEKGNCYVARYENTVEEEEGFGTRFHNLLDTFKLIDDTTK